MLAMLVRQFWDQLTVDLMHMSAAAMLAQRARVVDITRQHWGRGVRHHSAAALVGTRLSKASAFSARLVCHKSCDWPCTAWSCPGSLASYLQ